VVSDQFVEHSGDEWMTVGVNRVWWSGHHSFSVRVVKALLDLSVGVMSASVTACNERVGLQVPQSLW